MATITSSYCWLHSAADLTDNLKIEPKAFRVPPSMAGETRRRAGGRLVAVSRPGVARTATVTVQIEARDDLEWIIDHMGTLVLVRGPRGERIWGTYWAVDWTEAAQFEFPFAVTVAVEEVTTTEVV